MFGGSETIRPGSDGRIFGYRSNVSWLMNG
jgi:hypothetical protein